MPQGLIALVALADGSSSLYSSVGRAVIGGNSYESVSCAASEFLNFANALRGYMKPANGTPSPVAGTVAFYLRTDMGLITEESGEMELRHRDHPLFALYVSGHALIAELRMVCQRLS
jgi:hypothetical protein